MKIFCYGDDSLIKAFVTVVTWPWLSIAVFVNIHNDFFNCLQGLCNSLTSPPPSLLFFSRSFLLRTAPHYLNAWNRLRQYGNLTACSKIPILEKVFEKTLFRWPISPNACGQKTNLKMKNKNSFSKLKWIKTSFPQHSRFSCQIKHWCPISALLSIKLYTCTVKEK